MNAIGDRISTRIKQASYDPLNIEALMYMGDEVTTLYGRVIKKATWSQLFWKTMGCGGTEGCNSFDFIINPGAPHPPSMSYLLAFALEMTFPSVTLRNTEAPAPWYVQFAGADADVDAMSVVDNGEQLYFYVANGENGLPAGTVYVGTKAALTSSTGLDLNTEDELEEECACNGNNACNGLPPCSAVRPLVSNVPRHRVSWGHYAALAAIESMAFTINGIEYEELSKHALYNALQFRMREDVYPVAGEEATSMDATITTASTGNAASVVHDLDEDDRYKAFVAPFSFTTSALADRGTYGNHKSAFPVVLACGDVIKVRVNVIDDLRKLLVLEEESLLNHGDHRVVFVATDDELANGDTMYLSNGTTLVSVSDFAPTPIPGSTNTYQSVGATGDYTVTVNGTSTTYSASGNPFTLAGLGILFPIQSGCYHPVVRPTDYCLDNPFSVDTIDYRDWIMEDSLKLSLKGKALGASASRYENAMMKKDCRNKMYLYERYHLLDDSTLIKPGDRYSVNVIPAPGQFKYAYTFAQNELSRLQGHYFNYTNDTDYDVVDTLTGPRHRFLGKAAIKNAGDRVRGFQDEDHKYLFYRYVDNPLFTQRAPRQTGLLVAPRASNWINSIHPDGGINYEYVGDTRVDIVTARSGTTALPYIPQTGMCNTYGYNLYSIGVYWNIISFHIDKGCEVPPPPTLYQGQQ